MRMDIEFSPGARGQRSDAPPRDDWGLVFGERAEPDGAMTEKRVCSIRHPAAVRRGRRFTEERMKGILWRHSSINLVEPRPFAPSAARIPRRTPEIKAE
jgi:hypothetical protein